MGFILRLSFDLGKKYFTIFSDFTSNIHRSKKKLQNKKLYDQLWPTRSPRYVKPCCGRRLTV
jgi:hypothetical protein